MDAFGNTALHVAVERGHAGVVAALLESGASAGPLNAQVKSTRVMLCITRLLTLCTLECCRDARRCIMLRTLGA
jgi:ankyrin repeat protein